MEKYTYNDLRDFLASLSPSQLEQEVKVIGSTFGGPVIEHWILEDDYINPSGEGIEPKSTYEDEDGYDDRVILPKDTVLLVLN